MEGGVKKHLSRKTGNIPLSEHRLSYEYGFDCFQVWFSGF